MYLYPHLHFSIGFNNDQIVTANVTTDARRRVDITDITSGQEVSFQRSYYYLPLWSNAKIAVQLLLYFSDRVFVHC